MAISITSFLKPYPFELYLPEGPPPFPLICLTPILGRLAFLEDLFFERRFARFFSSHGLAVALIDRPIFEFDRNRNIEQIQEYLQGSVIRNQAVLDYLLQKKEIRPDRIGSFGISFGAVVNCLWAAQDTRLKAHVFALAGGNLPEIFLSSRDPLMRSYLKAVSEAVPKNQLKDTLQEALKPDPLEVCSKIPQEDILMLLAVFDRVVRLRYGLDLWRALGKPKTLFLPFGHYGALLAVPLIKWNVLSFLRSRLL